MKKNATSGILGVHSWRKVYAIFAPDYIKVGKKENKIRAFSANGGLSRALNMVGKFLSFSRSLWGRSLRVYGLPHVGIFRNRGRNAKAHFFVSATALLTILMFGQSYIHAVARKRKINEMSRYADRTRVARMYCTIIKYNGVFR